MPKDHIGSLSQAGFVRSGVWQQAPLGIVTENKEHSSRSNIPSNPGLYAFVVGKEIKYIGIAEKSLHVRLLGDYIGNQLKVRRGAKKRAVHMELFAALSRKETVAVYTLMPKDAVGEPENDIKWKGLPVHLLFGLEAGLIREFNPVWNCRGTRKVILEIPA